MHSWCNKQIWMHYVPKQYFSHNFWDTYIYTYNVEREREINLYNIYIYTNSTIQYIKIVKIFYIYIQCVNKIYVYIYTYSVYVYIYIYAMCKSMYTYHVMFFGLLLCSHLSGPTTPGVHDTNCAPVVHAKYNLWCAIPVQRNVL